MPSHDPAPDAMLEAFAATLYGLDATYRHDDAFDSTLAGIATWAESLDGYDTASIDIFTGTGYSTLAGRRQPRPVLDRVHAVLARDPRRFHTWSQPPERSERSKRSPAAAPGGWAGATLFAANGAVLGSLSLWSAAPLTPQPTTPDRLVVLARATMQTLEERRRVWNARAVVPPGPRAMRPRRSDPPV